MSRDSSCHDLTEAPNEAHGALRSQTLSNVKWASAENLVSQGIQFIIGVVLARLLTPEAFGLVGMVLVFSGFAHLFADFGLGSALVQRPGVRRDHLDTVFWVNTGAGGLAALVLCLAAPAIANFYGEPQLKQLAVVLSLTFVFNGLSVVQRALLSRALDFRRLALVGWGGKVVVAVVGIGMALSGFGVWSLVVHSVAGAAVTTVLLWSYSRWRPRWQFQGEALRELLGFSANVFGFQAFNYWVRNADNLLVGRFLGTASLGIYSRGYALMLIPVQQVGSVISRVMFPSLSSIQYDKERVGRIYLQSCNIVSFITAPLMFGLLATARPFVLTVFGPQWEAMIPLLTVLSLLGYVQSVATLVGSLFLSQGRSDLLFRTGGVIGVVGVLAMIVGLRWGMVGVAACYAAISLVAFVPQQHVALRLVGLSGFDMVRSISAATAVGMLMSVVVYGIGWILPTALSMWIVLSIQISIGLLVYVGVAHVFEIRAYHEVRNIIINNIMRISPSVA